MRLQDNPYFHAEGGMPSLVRQLDSIYRQTATQLNQLSDGRLYAVTNADTAAPTTGQWNQGDFIRNSAPAEAGSVGSMYVLHGWVCVASGEPGSWVQCRYLTGN
jgi:hypothetical protein